MVDPQSCTLLVLKQTAPYFYSVNDEEVEGETDEDRLLKSVFGKVVKETNIESCRQRIHHQALSSSSLLLLELDDDDSSTKEQIECIRTIANRFRTMPVIAYSRNEDVHFMQKCIQAGATQYVLRPLTADTAKTLFLALYQHQNQQQPYSRAYHPTTLYQDDKHLVSSSTISTVEEDDDPAVISPLTPTTFPSSVHLSSTSTLKHHHHFLPHRQHPYSNINSIKPTVVEEQNQQKTVREHDSSTLNQKSEHINAFAKSLLDHFIPPALTLPTYEPLTKELREKLQANLARWDFNPFQSTQEELVHCAVLILRHGAPDIAQKCFTEEQLYTFVIELSMSYHEENSYHNFAHAVDVLQCIYYFLLQLGLTTSFTHVQQQSASAPSISSSSTTTNGSLSSVGTTTAATTHYASLLRPIDIFALFIAALGHDTSHPGVNNAFLINTSAHLSCLYNDQSVLEHFHAMTLSQLLLKHGFQRRLSTVNNDTSDADNSNTYKEFRKVIVSTILATDMALHQDYIKKVKSASFFQTLQQRHKDMSESANSAPSATTTTATTTLEIQEVTEKDRLLFCCALMKCADISNVARPFAVAFQWAEILMEEFAMQGDLERELGLELSLPALMDRSLMVLEDTQLGFIRFVALGLFETISQSIEELSFTVNHITENISLWKRKKKDRFSETTTAVLRESAEDRNSSSSSYRSHQTVATTTTAIATISSKRSSLTVARADRSILKTAAATMMDTTTSATTSNSVLKPLPEMPPTAMPMTPLPITTTTATTPNTANNRYPNFTEGDDDLLDLDSRAMEGPPPVYCQCIVQ